MGWGGGRGEREEGKEEREGRRQEAPDGYWL